LFILFFAQRNSPSSPQEQADNHEGAGEGLDVTACSASSLLEIKGDIDKIFAKKSPVEIQTAFNMFCCRLLKNSDLISDDNTYLAGWVDQYSFPNKLDFIDYCPRVQKLFRELL
jgi:hypothetical protein